MSAFTYEEQELMSIYDPGAREGLIANLEEMRGYLEPDEEDRDIQGVSYAAEALLGLDEDGYCMSYIEAYKDDLFGVPKK